MVIFATTLLYQRPYILRSPKSNNAACHTRENVYLEKKNWIPACAGMTKTKNPYLKPAINSR
jgi:hypothetical protein